MCAGTCWKRKAWCGWRGSNPRPSASETCSQYFAPCAGVCPQGVLKIHQFESINLCKCHLKDRLDGLGEGTSG